MNIWKQTAGLPDQRDRLGGHISRFFEAPLRRGNTAQAVGAKPVGWRSPSSWAGNEGGPRAC